MIDVKAWAAELGVPIEILQQFIDNCEDTFYLEQVVQCVQLAQTS
jgi:hypothetical protein